VFVSKRGEAKKKEGGGVRQRKNANRKRGGEGEATDYCISQIFSNHQKKKKNPAFHPLKKKREKGKKKDACKLSGDPSRPFPPLIKIISSRKKKKGKGAPLLSNFLWQGRGRRKGDPSAFSPPLLLFLSRASEKKRRRKKGDGCAPQPD